MNTLKSQNIDVRDLLQGKVTPLDGQPVSVDDQPQNADNKESTAEPTQEARQESKELTHEEIVLKYFKDNGRDINSIDELLKEKEPKEINPYADILDEQDKAYLEFKRENPKKTRSDFDVIYSDLSKKNPLDFAREKVLQEAGIMLDNEQIDQYLEEELGVDLSAETLSTTDIIKLSKYGKEIKEQRIAEQKRYKQPTQNNDNSDYVRLENNTIMLKSDYDKFSQERQQYLKDQKEATNGVAVSVFSVEVDDNGQKRQLDYTYDYDQKDRHSMVSLTTDVQQMVRERYYSDKGFKHKEFNEDLFWIKPENRSKAIGIIVQKARAQAIEEVLKNRGNFSFVSKQAITTPARDGVKNVSIKELLGQ